MGIVFWAQGTANAEAYRHGLAQTVLQLNQVVKNNNSLLLLMFLWVIDLGRTQLGYSFTPCGAV